ncbi:hypothetical protein F4819DRAFT_468824 [Hypoxylon fuscum]|nr:hypothetical protein F4819DRAFT_468824 [Hypoxylon fuscum]
MLHVDFIMIMATLSLLSLYQAGARPFIEIFIGPKSYARNCRSEPGLLSKFSANRLGNIGRDGDVTPYYGLIDCFRST